MGFFFPLYILILPYLIYFYPISNLFEVVFDLILPSMIVMMMDGTLADPIDVPDLHIIFLIFTQRCFD